MRNLDRPESQADELRTFLKSLRSRIQPESSTLGPHLRLAKCVGRPVSQEELAEHVGISRNWYSMLESGATTRTSLTLLTRLAAALMATPCERGLLLNLAIREFPQQQMRLAS